MAESPTISKRVIPAKSAEDPFRDAKPLTDLTVLIGGLPDDRDADEILCDLRRARTVGPRADRPS
jgi:hypothetical protein